FNSQRPAGAPPPGHGPASFPQRPVLLTVLEVQARRQVLHGHRRPPRVSVQQQQWLVVALNAARHHVLPLGSDLKEEQKHGERSFRTQRPAGGHLDKLRTLKPVNAGLFYNRFGFK
ncbi:hypothetical protein XENOCAPTIV_030406, partial [Xenoophorus captivus]